MHDHVLVPSCKTVIGIICDATCTRELEEDSYKGNRILTLRSSFGSAAWARRSKMMREASTPCRTP